MHTKRVMDTKEILMILIYVGVAAGTIIINPLLLENTNLTITLLEIQKIKNGIEHSETQVLIQNTGNTQIHEIKVGYRTGNPTEVIDFIHLEGINYAVDNQKGELVVDVEKLSPYSYFLIHAEGELREDYNRLLIVSNDETRTQALNFPNFERGIVSNKTNEIPEIIFALIVGGGLLILVRFIAVKRHESIRKENFSFNLKPEEVISTRFFVLLFGYLFSIILVMGIKIKTELIPFEKYIPYDTFEIPSPFNINSFLISVPHDPFTIQWIHLLLLIIFFLCLIMIFPNSKPQRTWRHEKNISVSEISNMFVPFQIVKLVDKMKTVHKKNDVVIVKGENDIVAIMPIEIPMINRIQKNYTIEDLLTKKIKSRSWIQKFLSLFYATEGIVQRINSNMDIYLNDIVSSKSNFLIVKYDEKIIQVIQTMEESSKRFALIMKEDEIIGVLDYTLLK